ncbi:MAG: hypothetical protein NVSMB24_34000 [Mucilaginibacter sp.]
MIKVGHRKTSSIMKKNVTYKLQRTDKTECVVHIISLKYPKNESHKAFFLIDVGEDRELGYLIFDEHNSWRFNGFLDLNEQQLISNFIMEAYADEFGALDVH